MLMGSHTTKGSNPLAGIEVVGMLAHRLLSDPKDKAQ